jgi:hypothetical protein
MSFMQELGIHTEVSEGGYQQLSLYSPYWMINKTERDLAYKVLRCDCHIVSQSSSFITRVNFRCIPVLICVGSLDAKCFISGLYIDFQL